MRLQDVKPADWGRELVVPTDSLEYLQSAQKLCGEEVEVFWYNGEEPLCLSKSCTNDSAYELFGDVVSNWRITNTQPILNYLVSRKETFLLNGIDGMSSGNLNPVALQIPANMLITNYLDWDCWLEQKGKKHRYRIKENLKYAYSNGVEVHSARYASTVEFTYLLDKQVDHLTSKVWESTYDASCLTRMQSVWRACIASIASTKELNPQFFVIRGQAATLTCRVGDRVFFIITLANREYPDAGVACLATAVRASVENPSISYFDLGIGNDHYKRMYEPDLAYKNSLLCVYPTEFWKDPDAAVAEIPTPPFIVNGKLYTLEAHPLPEVQQLIHLVEANDVISA